MRKRWRILSGTRTTCQFCKQERNCSRGPDPFLLNFFDETEIVWLCDECYSLRRCGGHLGDEEWRQW